MDKLPFNFLRKWRVKEESHCEYEASFWEGPIYAGQKGRYRRVKCHDIWNGKKFLNTAPNVSYYSQLVKAVS
jgi:hypothetical protein